MDEFTDHESYGILRNDTYALVRKHNVSPADMMLIQLDMREDWDRINDFILSHVRGMLRNFHYPFARR